MGSVHCMVSSYVIQVRYHRPVASINLFHSEENSTIPGVGVDQLLKDGKLEKFKNGPIYWVDSADTNPCMGNG